MVWKGKMLWLIVACLPLLVRIITNAFLFKGTHSNVRFTMVTLKSLADHLDDFHIFLYFRNAQVNFVENPHLKLISFRNYKHWYLIHTRPDEGFEGTVVNQALSSLHRESVEISLIVPFKRNEINFPFAWANIREN